MTPTGEAVASPFGYKGREEDRETGLVYMRNRFYSPRLERFVNQDPMGIAGGLNTFAFAGMNPVNVADPLGLDPDDPCDPRFYICLPPIFVLAWVPGDGRDLADLLALDNFTKGMMAGSWP